MKTHNMLIAFVLLATSILSNGMENEVKLPSAETLKTYLQEYTDLDWFIHEDHPEISADIPKYFGNRINSPSKLKRYLWTIDSQLCERCGIMQPTKTHDEEITKTIYEIINLVFKDYPDLLKQINDIDYPASLKAINDMHSFPPTALLKYANK